MATKPQPTTVQKEDYLTSADGDWMPLNWQEAHKQEIDDIKAQARTQERNKVIEEFRNAVTNTTWVVLETKTQKLDIRMIMIVKLFV